MGRFLGYGWNRKSKRSSSTKLRVNGDLPAMSLHDFLTGRQSDAGARVFVAAMKTPKNIEYLLMVLSSNTDPIVAYRNLPRIVSLVSANLNSWRFVAAIRDCVANQVLQQLDQLNAISSDDR
jgi:hypothetical protein